MRFYLDLPLVVGYSLMAISACLGVLQFAAARGGYSGLALFTSRRGLGLRIGGGIAVGSLTAYVLFAPEIMTPGPAGTEVAEMFVACALIALGITLVGADFRIRSGRDLMGEVGEGIKLSNGRSFKAVVYHPTPPCDSAPVVIIVPDPMGFVSLPSDILDVLRRSGMAVVVLDVQPLMRDRDLWSRSLLLEYIATTLSKGPRVSGLSMERVAVLGLGLSGDVALWTSSYKSGVSGLLGVMAVSPVGLVGRLGFYGVQWLHELSYRQAWLWRRQAKSIQAIVKQEGLSGRKTVIPSAVLGGGRDRFMTMRKYEGLQILKVDSTRHFTLLSNRSARQAMVDWFEQRLRQPEVKNVV